MYHETNAWYGKGTITIPYSLGCKVVINIYQESHTFIARKWKWSESDLVIYYGRYKRALQLKDSKINNQEEFTQI